MKLFLSLVLAISMVSVVSANDFRRCEKLMDNLGTSTDLNLINICSEFYWHHQQYDRPVASYSNIIKLMKRYVEVDPYTIDEYTTAAWLLYSQWVHYKKDPEGRAYGKDKDIEAVAILVQGREFHLEDAYYHFWAGAQIEPMARHHDEKYYEFVLESYHLAEIHAKDQKILVRSRLSLGHTYRVLNETAIAISWYKKVLEVDPNNKIAKNYLKQLEG